MEDDLILFHELEGLIIRFKKLCDRETVGLKTRSISVAITLLEEALAYYAYFVIGVPIDFKLEKEKATE